MEEIHFAPLQGFTDLAYRLSHFQYIGGVDFYYTPYFSIDDPLSLKTKNFSEGLLNRTIPQILPGNLNELKVLVKLISDLHFSNININLGCPYPMVTRKGRGAGLIQKPDLVSQMVNYINNFSDLKISIKTRLGLFSANEIFDLLEKISPLIIDSIIIHPRTAKQLYNGKASPEMFLKCKDLFPDVDFVYNGDINTFKDFTDLKGKNQGQRKWMLGRGLLSDPMLGWRIKNENKNFSDYEMDKLYEFAFILINNIERDSKNEGHALNRVKSQFIYLCNSFPESRKIYRVVKKSKSIVEVKEILMGGEFQAKM
jgi:tRNA-dihydrouridine synthase B